MDGDMLSQDLGCNALVALGFLAMTLTHLGMAIPPHRLVDTLDLVPRLYILHGQATAWRMWR